MGRELRLTPLASRDVKPLATPQKERVKEVAMTIHQMCEAAARERCTRCGRKAGEACDGMCYHLARFAQAVKHGTVPVDEFVILIPANYGFGEDSLVPDIEAALAA